MEKDFKVYDIDDFKERLIIKLDKLFEVTSDRDKSEFIKQRKYHNFKTWLREAVSHLKKGY